MHDAVVFSLLKGTCDSERPWSKESRIAFICPVPGYDRHFFICQEFGIEMIPVPLLATGPDMDAVEKLVAADPQIKGMWCVPKYSNPSGTRVLERDRRAHRENENRSARLPRVLGQRLCGSSPDETSASKSRTSMKLCAHHGNPNRAFIFGSTSKITFAGAGVGLFAGSKDNVAWYLKRMEKRTIGGDKVNQLRHIRLLKNTDGIAKLMDRHRAIMAPKFAKVLEGFQEHLGNTGVAEWTEPKGGYFITLDVLEGTAKQVVKLAKEAGVELTPAGSTHPGGNDPDDRTIRIAPSFPPANEVALAVEGVVLSVLLAATEKLLERQS